MIRNTIIQNIPSLSAVSPPIARILEKSLCEIQISTEEAEKLFYAEEQDLNALLEVANYVKKLVKGDWASFVICRNINFTNICYMGCKFCGFAKSKNDSRAETLSFETIVNRAREAYERGATEVCIQGGLNPDLSGEHYEKIIRAIKSELPDIHIHAFSPFEILNGSRKTEKSYEDFLAGLKSAGLGTIPGTAAEILDIEIRQQLTRNKLSTEDWIKIIKAAHKVGLKSTSTIMYGHIDNPSHWAKHMETIREIQKETGGITEFVPLGFVHYESPLYVKNSNVRPGPTREENLKMHAVARLYFRGLIDNIQVSWVKLGPDMAREILNAGANDLGGTLMNESISRSSGAKYGQEITPYEMVSIIRESGNIPFQRNTLYEMVEDYSDKDPIKTEPLVERLEVANSFA